VIRSTVDNNLQLLDFLFEELIAFVYIFSHLFCLVVLKFIRLTTESVSHHRFLLSTFLISYIKLPSRCGEVYEPTVGEIAPSGQVIVCPKSSSIDFGQKTSSRGGQLVDRWSTAVV